MSTRSYYDGDMKYAEKWADHAFMVAMATLGITLILGVAIGFTLSNLGLKGGHPPWRHHQIWDISNPIICFSQESRCDCLIAVFLTLKKIEHKKYCFPFDPRICTYMW